MHSRSTLESCSGRRSTHADPLESAPRHPRQLRKEGGRVAGLASADRARRRLRTPTPELVLGGQTPQMPCRLQRESGGQQSDASRQNRRLDPSGQSTFGQDLHRIDGFCERQAAPARARRRLLVIVRPRSATLMDERMFSSAFSTRRNAAIACTSGSLGSGLIVTGVAVSGAILKCRRSIERHRGLQILDRVVVEERARVGGLHDGGRIELLDLHCPNGGARSSVLPNAPNSGRICPKPPSRGKPSASASGISFTLVGAAMLPPCGLPSRSGNPASGG